MHIFIFIGVSLSELHTNKRNGVNITFTKVYVKTLINGTFVAHLQKFTIV